ncbi:MAG: thymidylate synthase, partial [Chrysiogenales bacterium]
GIISIEDGKTYLNQMELLIWTYKNKGHRNNQMVLQVAHPADMLLQDPPCLRLIDTRIQDGRLNFIIYFRSWDLWGGFPANLAAMQMMKEYIASEVGVEDGEIIAASKGLHIYRYVWELAECIRGKTIEEFRRGG